MAKNVVLVGFMGTGKSSVGSRLAQRLRMQFLDMDREIEHLLGMPVDRIFRVHGEKRFRSEESIMAQKLGQKENLVIATGGGVVMNPKNIEALKQNGIVVRLQASPEDILKRVSRKKGTRPLIKKDVKVEQIVKMLNEREEYYKMADFTIDTSGRDLDDIVNNIINFIIKYNKSAGDEAHRA